MSEEYFRNLAVRVTPMDSHFRSFHSAVRYVARLLS